MRKQSGPFEAVKSRLLVCVPALWAALLPAALLSACALGPRWQQADRTAAATRADLTNCEKDAERETLAARGATRGSYGAGAIGPDQGQRAADPMALKDRTDAAIDFDKSVRRCMVAQGYTDANDRRGR